MKVVSFNEDLVFGETKVVTQVIVETPFSKEIRILLKKGQVMKEHKAPFPISVHILDGAIDFGVHGIIQSMKLGDIVVLDAHVPHDLTAMEDSIVRLTLSKFDDVARVEKVVEA